MDLDVYDEDNPNLDGDYKAVLQRRREIAAAKELVGGSYNKTVASSVGYKEDAAPSSSHVIGPEQLLQQELRDELFSAADSGRTTSVPQLLARVRELRLSLTSQCLRQENGETVLHRALLNGDDSLAAAFIGDGGNNLVLATYVTEIDGSASEYTCMHLACQHCSLCTVQALVQALPNEVARKEFLLKMALVLPEGQRARKLSCLHIAAKAGKVEIVRYLIRECHMPVDLKNDKSDTPLLWAANDGRTEVVELLISLGACVDEQNDKGSSALHWAVRGRHLPVVEALLDKGKANANIRRKLGLVCPLVTAAAMAFDDVVKVLIKYGADVNAGLHSKETVLHYAAGEGATDVCKILIAAGAPVDPVDSRGDTPLLEAAAHYHVDTVAYLVRSGASVVQTNVDRHSVWSYAISADSCDMLETLLQLAEHWQLPARKAAAATLSSLSMRARLLEFPPGVFPLHAAAEKGDSNKIAMLLKFAADPACRDTDGNTFVHVAAMQNHADILQSYCDETTASATNADGNTPLHLACKRGNADAMRILAKKTKLQATNAAGMTALHEAAKCKRIDAAAVSLLVTQMIQSHDWTLLDAADKNKNTALHLAVSCGNVQVVHALKPLSAKVTNHVGNTPLHLAAMKRDEAIFLQLLEDRSSLAADVFDALNDDRKSILHLAIEKKHKDHVEHIIEAGTDIGKRGPDGNTAMHILADLMASDGDAKATYMQIVKLIIGKSHIWWAATHKVPKPMEDTTEQHEATAMAFRRLFLEIRNDDGLNALQYAAARGCAALVHYVLNNPRVFRHRAPDKENAFVYDVTDLTPATVVLQDRGGRGGLWPFSRRLKKSATAPAKTESKINLTALGVIGGSQASSATSPTATDGENGDCDDAGSGGGSSQNGSFRKESLLELIVSNDNLTAAAAVLDVEPVASVTTHYWAAYQWLFTIIMAFHIIHMTLVSHYAPLMMSESLAACSGALALLNGSSALPSCSQSPSPRSYVAAECALLVGPTCIVLFELADLTQRLRALAAARSSPQSSPAVGAAKRLRTDASIVLGVFLRLCGLGHSLTFFAWYALFRLRAYDQDYALAVALVLGWVFSLHFTRGFKTIHRFNLMLRHMIFRDVPKFLVFFVFILLGFGMAQYTMIRSDPVNSALDPIDTLFMLFNWLIGMAGFWSEPTAPQLLNRYAFEAVLFTCYCIVSTIVLINLLIATMSDSYGEVRDSSALFWKVNSIQMAIDIETFVPTVTRALRKLPCGRGPLRYDSSESKWYCLVGAPHKRLAAAATGDDAVKGAVSALDDKVSALQKELSSVKDALDQLLAHVQDSRPRLLRTLSSALAQADKLRARPTPSA